MMSRRSITKVLAAAFAAPSLAQTAKQDSSRPHDARGAIGKACGPWLPQALNINQFLTCPVLLHGEPTTAMIDTGFSRSGVKTDFIRQFGLSAGTQSQLRGFSGSITSTEYRLNTLQIAELVFPELAVLGLDQTPIPLPRTVSMIVGCDLLRQMVLEVDFPGDVLRLCSPGQPFDSSSAERVEAAATAGSVAKIPLKLEGKQVPAAVLDTGSNAACSISRAYADQLGLLDGRRQSTVLTAGIEGVKTDAVITLRDIQIGSFTVNRVPATVVDEWILDTPLNIGWPLLRAFDMRIDLAGGALWLRAEARVLAEPFPRDRSGLGAVRLSNRLLVRHVAAGSPAERAGVAVGDEIIGINDHPIGDDFPRPGERQGYKAAGTALDLELVGGRHVQLVLEDYF